MQNKTGTLKLYTKTHHLRGQSIAIAAEIAGVQLEEVLLKKPEQKTEEFLKLNPLGEIPVLVTSEGEQIFQTSAILRHIARIGKENNNLLGKNLYENSLVDQWCDFFNLEFFKGARGLLAPILGFKPKDQEVEKNSLSLLHKNSKILEETLGKTSYLIGDSLSVADLLIVPTFVILFRLTLNEKFLEKYPNLKKWFFLVSDRAEFKKHLGNLHICKTPLK